MARTSIRMAQVAVLGFVAFALVVSSSLTTAAKEDEKLPDIKKIMKLAHGKTDGYLAKIGTAAKAEKWDDAKKTATDLTIVADALAKNKPEKGDEKSWEKLTTKYKDSAKAVLDATEKKDLKATNTALGAIGMSCGGCHKVHK